MASYLTINKNEKTITLKFRTDIYKEKKDGEAVTKIIQSGLGAFAMTLHAYLTRFGTDENLNHLPKLEITQNENIRRFSMPENNNNGSQRANDAGYNW